MDVRLFNFTDINLSHVLGYLRCLEKQSQRCQLQASTVLEYVSRFRKCLNCLGKRELLPDGAKFWRFLDQHGIKLEPRPPRENHDSASERGIDAKRVIRTKIACVDEEIAHNAELTLEFGLRAREVVRRPMHNGCEVGVDAGPGSKGGRPRVVPFSADVSKREAQQELINVSLARRNGTLEQNLAYQKHVFHAAGVTTKQLGISQKSFRTEFAVNRFKELTGLPAPTLQECPLESYLDAEGKVLECVLDAYLIIGIELGHNRKDVAEVYLGSLSQMKAERDGARKIADALAFLGDIFVECNVEAAMLASYTNRRRELTHILTVKFHPHVDLHTVRTGRARIVQALEEGAQVAIQVEIEERMLAQPPNACVVFNVSEVD